MEFKEKHVASLSQQKSLCLTSFSRAGLFLSKLIRSLWGKMVISCCQKNSYAISSVCIYIQRLSYSLLLKTSDLFSPICIMFTFWNLLLKLLLNPAISKLDCRFSLGLKFTWKPWYFFLKPKGKISLTAKKILEIVKIFSHINVSPSPSPSKKKKMFWEWNWKNENLKGIENRHWRRLDDTEYNNTNEWGG